MSAVEPDTFVGDEGWCSLPTVRTTRWGNVVSTGSRFKVFPEDVPGLYFIIIIKRLCYHAICQMNAIAIAMQAMNRGRDIHADVTSGHFGIRKTTENV